jgi:hypothetical protein
MSKEFQHPGIQTIIEQHFGRIFNKIKVYRKKGIYTNHDPNMQEVGFTVSLHEAA